MVKRKSVWWLLVVALLVIVPLLAACGAPKEEAPAPTAPAKEVPAAKEEAPAAPTAPTTPTPPNIPAAHATAGCPVCHQQGIGGAPKWPDNHAGFTEQMCTGCHQPAG